MTDREITDEKLREILAGCAEATPGPWEADGTQNDGEYGNGDDTHSGFGSYQVLADVRGQSAAVVDTINASYLITEVNEEFDEDGHYAWDEQGRKNAAHIARLDPQTVSAIVTELLSHRANRIEEAARVAALERAVEFVTRWAWRDGPLTDEERLSAIKYHPAIKPKERT